MIVLHEKSWAHNSSWGDHESNFLAIQIQNIDNALLQWDLFNIRVTTFLLYCTSQSQVILLRAGDRVAGLPLLRQQPGTVACGAPPQSLLPQRHWAGWQRDGDELSGGQEHRPAGLPPLEQTDGHGGPERSDAQDQDWAMTWSTEDLIASQSWCPY